jgi:hypothetical protein
MALDWTGQLLEQLTFHWEQHARPRLEGLTDDEYFWEPVEGSWSIRPRAEARTVMAPGAGDLVADFAFPEPDPPPEFLAFADVEASVRQDVDAIRHCGHLPPGFVAWGAVYDVDTGALRVVAPPLAG